MSINDKLKNILTQLRSHFEQLYGDRLTQMVIYGSHLNKPLTGGQDAQPLLPTKKLTLCGTGILPVPENGKRCNCEHFHLL
ncbi:hypothetical protein [Microcoleus sp. Pol10D4]|uniref:hypothetical protein n=1 Tax=Microcoleus sp. Pol10D4 TaxID=3055387 RepID=UPI002FD13041